MVMWKVGTIMCYSIKKGTNGAKSDAQWSMSEMVSIPADKSLMLWGDSR